MSCHGFKQGDRIKRNADGLTATVERVERMGTVYGRDFSNGRFNGSIIDASMWSKVEPSGCGKHGYTVGDRIASCGRVDAVLATVKKIEQTENSYVVTVHRESDAPEGAERNLSAPGSWTKATPEQIEYTDNKSKGVDPIIRAGNLPGLDGGSLNVEVTIARTHYGNDTAKLTATLNAGFVARVVYKDGEQDGSEYGGGYGGRLKRFLTDNKDALKLTEGTFMVTALFGDGDAIVFPFSVERQPAVPAVPGGIEVKF